MKRLEEKAYLEAAGFKEEDLILTPEERQRRIQEDAYFSMIDGKGDHDCDHEH